MVTCPKLGAKRWRHNSHHPRLPNDLELMFFFYRRLANLSYGKPSSQTVNFFSLLLPHGIACEFLGDPDQGSHPVPLHWALGVLIIGPPGKSPNCFNILDLVGYTVSATTTQPCHYSIKEATGNMYNGRVWQFPIKFRKIDSRKDLACRLQFADPCS